MPSLLSQTVLCWMCWPRHMIWGIQVGTISAEHSSADSKPLQRLWLWNAA